jgi:flagellar biosynthesis component FlhA
MPNKVSQTGSFALLSSEKLINQLEEIDPAALVLAGVLVTALGVWPVMSVISAASISAFTGTIEYWLVVSWPIFLGILVTW